MAAIKGYDGSLDWGGIIDSDVAYNTNSWSLDITGDTHDITDFTSAGWREFLAGLKSWTGSLELFQDGTNTIVPSDVGSSATIKCYLNSTHYLHGSAICTGYSPTAAVDGVETASLTFQGTSDLWYS